MSWRALLSTSVRELRWNFCPEGAGSAPVRAFLQNNYTDLKTLNPGLPFLIRDAPGLNPVLFARFDFGVEKRFDLANLSERDIEDQLRHVVEQGKTMPRSAESAYSVTDIENAYL